MTWSQSYALSTPRLNLSKLRSTCKATSVDYIPPKIGLESLNLPLSLMAASPRFELDDENGKWLIRCSSSVISDTGNILVDAHCVDDCISKAGLFKKTDEGSLVDREALKNLTCFAKINNEPVKFNILAMSDCYGGFDEARIKEYPNQICNGVDYAIIHPDASSPQLPCLKHNFNKPKVGTKLATIGFPTKTYRYSVKRPQNSDGLSQQMSFGEVLSYQPYCYIKEDDLSFLDFGKRAFTTKQANLSKKLVETGNVMQSSVDIVKGSSGGSFFNEQGAVVGVASFGLAGPNINSEGRQCDGSTFFVPLSAVVADIKKPFPDVSLENIFGCEQKAAIK